MWSRRTGWRWTNTCPPAARVAPSARVVSGREPDEQIPILFDAPRPNYVSPRNPLQLYAFVLCQRSDVRVKYGSCVAVRPEHVGSEAPYRALGLVEAFSHA